MLHTMLIGQGVYRQQMAFANDTQLSKEATEHVPDVLLGMDTRDPLEEMLVTQALWTHGRLAHLSWLANQQTAPENVQVVNDACDRASNTFRRLMLALAEYRRPPRNDAFVAIKQANVAQQQVIANAQNPNPTKPILSNEVGSTPAKALPPHCEGFDLATALRPATSAVAMEHRPQDAGRQSRRQDECPAPR